jgi:hypothetical protein
VVQCIKAAERRLPTQLAYDRGDFVEELSTNESATSINGREKNGTATYSKEAPERDNRYTEKQSEK